MLCSIILESSQVTVKMLGRQSANTHYLTSQERIKNGRIFRELQICYEEKSLKAAEFAKKAAEMTHTIYTANQKNQKALGAIKIHDKVIM